MPFAVVRSSSTAAAVPVHAHPHPTQHGPAASASASASGELPLSSTASPPSPPVAALLLPDPAKTKAPAADAPSRLPEAPQRQSAAPLGTTLTPPLPVAPPTADAAHAPEVPLAPGGRQAPRGIADMLLNACVWGAAFACCNQCCARLWSRFDHR